MLLFVRRRLQTRAGLQIFQGRCSVQMEQQVRRPPGRKKLGKGPVWVNQVKGGRIAGDEVSGEGKSKDDSWALGPSA